MADGEITYSLQLKLSESAARQLRERADRLGLTLDAAAASVIEQTLFDYDDYDWGDDRENDPRTATVGSFEAEAPTVSLEEAMAAFDAELERRLAARQ